MKSSEILRRAARMVEREQSSFGCFAILKVMRLYRTGELRGIPEPVLGAFRKVAPRGRHLSDPWWFADDGGMDARIIGLCLAAAIAEDEGD